MSDEAPADPTPQPPAELPAAAPASPQLGCLAIWCIGSGAVYFVITAFGGTVPMWLWVVDGIVTGLLLLVALAGAFFNRGTVVVRQEDAKGPAENEQALQ